MNTAIQTTKVKMFANFDRQIFVPLTGEMDNNVDNIHTKLKELGANLGRHSISALMEGKEAMLRGFEVVTVADKHIAATAAKRSMDDEMIARLTKTGYVAAGEVLAVRRGSKIAIGLEKLKEGCTIEELKEALGHESGESVQSFLNYRPKKRGYGLKKEGDLYFLVMPEGHTEILYK